MFKNSDENVFKKLKKEQYVCAKKFNEESLHSKLKALESFYMTYEKIVLHLKESSCCVSCLEKEMNYCYSSLLNIHGYENFPHQLRLHALSFLRQVYKHKLSYLKQRGKNVELTQFKKYHHSMTQPLMLVS